jgi:hypothetical protein
LFLPGADLTSRVHHYVKPADLRLEDASASRGLATVRDMAEPERAMRVIQVDERDSAWEDRDPRFLVYLYGSGAASTGGGTGTYDITGADVLQVIDRAQRQADGRLAYAVALVRGGEECERISQRHRTAVASSARPRQARCVSDACAEREMRHESVRLGVRLTHFRPGAASRRMGASSMMGEWSGPSPAR